MVTRPGWLRRNRHSLQAQSDPDYQHLVLTDDEGRGYDYANALVVQALPRIRGRYVLLLDDDDIMSNLEGIALLKEAAVGNPPVIVFRGHHADFGVLPDKAHWQRRPAMGNIGSFDFITRANLFQAHAEALRNGGYPSDFHLISSLYAAFGPEFVWLDEILCSAPVRNMGASEPC